MPFQPHKPEKTIKAEITMREAALIKKLRTAHFGRFIIHKQDNLIMRIESTESYLIKESEGETLEGAPL